MTKDVENWLAAQDAATIETLKDFCRIPSVSTDPAFAADVRRAAQFVVDRLTDAQLPTVELVETDGHPCIFAEWIVDPAKPTILIYGHYDVQPPDPLGKWQTPPFEPDIRNDRLYARGASDDKGSLLIPLMVARAYAAVHGAPPLNLKFLIEGEEESGSPHFAPTVAAMADRLACDLVVSADGAMWRADLPSITVASRGMLAMELTVRGASKDLHSGRHGGSAPNPVRALARMMASLHDDDGRVTVPGFADAATPPDPAIIDAINDVAFDVADYFDSIGAPRPDPLPDGPALLTRQWLVPTLEFNGISGGYAGQGTKTVIPSEAAVKITCRLVAGQDPDAVFAAIRDHLTAVRPAGYTMDLHRHGPGSKAFALDPDMPGLAVAEEILTDIMGTRPLRVAMGATIPIGAVFAAHLDVGTIFFSFSTSDEDYHAPNEFYRLSSLRSGQIAWARLFDRLAL
ncbi:M20/M25/M40 family metallo-hydrolase [Loktanella sp. M215]|uniref:M20/M25/M40 family metallo-hydrolase n=1 Tax=Loktanella sp. M215 TaxID=2675431 RepID=UPI001F38EB67|nr:M20/M25/M40 family metallo-hydrolase [Loktanella sp. M215]MCF7700736.1 M20/M25/M40 family metallo-hydrolase [Loktanella sp. M215]